MNENREIEYYAAVQFLKKYNIIYNESFRIERHQDAPDFICRNNKGNELKIEISQSEDMAMDIPALLGRKKHKMLNNVIKNKNDFTTHFPPDILPIVIDRINKKLLTKDYGQNTALVIIHESPRKWSWDLYIEQIRDKLKLRRNNYDKGIWLITMDGQRLYNILEPFSLEK